MVLVYAIRKHGARLLHCRIATETGRAVVVPQDDLTVMACSDHQRIARSQTGHAAIDRGSGCGRTLCLLTGVLVTALRQAATWTARLLLGGVIDAPGVAAPSCGEHCTEQ